MASPICQSKVVLLDTNCLIYLAQDVQPYATDLRELVGRFRGGGLEITAAGITASENSPSGSAPRTWADFMRLLAAAKLADIRVLEPMGYFGVSFWGHALWVGESMAVLEREIHGILAPNVDIEDRSRRRKWLNTKCDVQLVWTHIWHKTDLLVTNDKGILSKAEPLFELGAAVLSPRAARETLVDSL